MKQLTAFVEAFHEHFTHDPNARVYRGIDRDLGELPDPTLAADAETVARARRLLAQLDGIEADSLGFHDRLDLSLARLALEADVERLTRTLGDDLERARKPTAADDIGDPIFMMFVTDPRPAEARLEDITSRIEEIPDFLAGLADRLTTPQSRWADMERKKVLALDGLFDNLVVWANRERWADEARLKRASDEAMAAIVRYTDNLAKMASADDLHIGTERAEEIVRLRGIELSLDELHAIAHEFLTRTRGQLEALRDELAARHGLPRDIDLAELNAALDHKFSVKVSDLDEIVDVYIRENERIVEFINERQLFPILDNQAMRILRTPKFLEPTIPAGAMVPPPAFRQGVRESIVYLTLHPDQLDDHTLLSIPSMMVHEGIPGHHLHLATASTHESVIRRHKDYADQAEGWTTLLEDYMLDEGLMGELTDEARFIGKRDISRIGARVAIDLYFMTGRREYLDVGVPLTYTGDDPFDAAAELLIAVTGFSAGRAAAELNWYSQERGYPLSYLAGNHLVWQLKRDIIEAQRGKLAGHELDRAFHKSFLDAGNMPVTYLRQVMEHDQLL